MRDFSLAMMLAMTSESRASRMSMNSIVLTGFTPHSRICSLTSLVNCSPSSERDSMICSREFVARMRRTAPWRTFCSWSTSSRNDDTRWATVSASSTRKNAVTSTMNGRRVWSYAS